MDTYKNSKIGITIYILCADFNVIHARANMVINISYVIILKIISLNMNAYKLVNGLW